MPSDPSTVYNLIDEIRRAVATIRHREQAALEAMAEGFTDSALEMSTATIASLRNRIATLSSS